jgi:hypothetical protein
VIEQMRADAAAHASADNGFLGDPFRPVEDHFYGHLVSALDPTVRRVAPRPLPAVAATPPDPVDLTLDVLAVRIARRQDVDELSVSVRVAEPATLTARARVRIRAGAARAIVSRPATAHARPHVTPGFVCDCRLRA